MKKITLFYLAILNLFFIQALQAQELLGDFEQGSTPNVLFNATTTHNITTTYQYPYIQVYLYGGVFNDSQTTSKTFYSTKLVSFEVLWNNCEAFEKGTGSFEVILMSNPYFGNYNYSLKTILPELNYLLYNEYSYKPVPHQDYCSAKQLELDNYFNTIYADCKTLDIEAIINSIDPTGCCNLNTNFCSNTVCEDAQKTINIAIADDSLSNYDKYLTYIKTKNANPDCTELTFSL